MRPQKAVEEWPDGKDCLKWIRTVGTRWALFKDERAVRSFISRLPNVECSIFYFHRGTRFSQTCIVDDPIGRIIAKAFVWIFVETRWNEMGTQSTHRHFAHVRQKGIDHVGKGKRSLNDRHSQKPLSMVTETYPRWCRDCLPIQVCWKHVSESEVCRQIGPIFDGPGKTNGHLRRRGSKQEKKQMNRWYWENFFADHYQRYDDRTDEQEPNRKHICWWLRSVQIQVRAKESSSNWFDHILQYEPSDQHYKDHSTMRASPICMRSCLSPRANERPSKKIFKAESGCGADSRLENKEFIACFDVDFESFIGPEIPQRIGFWNIHHFVRYIRSFFPTSCASHFLLYKRRCRYA